MYRYLSDISINSSDILKTPIIADIDFLTDIIYNYSYNIIKDKFNILSSKYKNSIYLNPYARTILILKVAKEYINKKLNIYKLIKIKNSNSSNPSNPSNPITNSALNKCKSYIKYLYLYNGDIEFDPITYKKVDFDDKTYNYMFIEQFAKKYLTSEELDALNKECKIPNHMFSNSEHQHVYFNQFIDATYNLFYNLQIYQIYIQQFEINNIKKYINKLLINKMKKYSLEKDKNKEYNYLFDSSQISTFKKYISVSNQKAIFIKNNDFTNNIILTIDTSSDFNDKFEEIDILNSNSNLKITSLLKDIKKEYIEVLNINPFDIKFKNIEVQTDPFDFIYSYKQYKKIYKSI